MATIDRDDLRREKAEELEWSLNPIKKAILDLLGDELTEAKYRKLTKEQIIEITERRLNEATLGNVNMGLTRRKRSLISRMKSRKTIKEVILVLGEYLI